MRTFRNAALGATMLALLVGACTSGGSSPSPTATAATSPPAESPGETPSGATLASTLTLGGPPECPQRPFCAIGLKDVYGIEFGEFRPLDVGGPITVQAVKGGDVDVGLLFTSDPAIVVEGFVLLEDDKQLQNADNVVPVIRRPILDAAPGTADLINPWMARLDQATLIDFNRKVGVDGGDPSDVVRSWLDLNGLSTGTSGDGTAVKIGSFNFTESEILGELLAQILEANGYSVERKYNLGNREITFPSLESGEIDLIAEYAATVLEFTNNNAGEATGDAAETVAKLNERLASRELVALEPAPATDQNGFVVTQSTADQYGLSKMSDLAKPAP